MSYYDEHLSGERLRRCYEIVPPRIEQYLEAEIEFVRDRIKPHDAVLELGCGYGRVLRQLTDCARTITGIDTSTTNLELAREILGDETGCRLLEMDACALEFDEASFDVVLCIQNGICAFNVDQRRVIDEAWRVTKEGGTVLFSTYAACFWAHRLDWFRRQVAEGLLGEIDEAATGDGVIACKDGFRAGALSGEDFLKLTSHLHVEPVLTEVDGSSLFCEIKVDRGA